MHEDHNIFIQAIKSRKKVHLTCLSDGQQQTVTRLVVPIYYGPDTLESVSDSYHFWDALADDEQYMATLSADQILHMELSEERFDPADL